MAEADYLVSVETQPDGTVKLFYHSGNVEFGDLRDPKFLCKEFRLLPSEKPSVKVIHGDLDSEE